MYTATTRRSLTGRQIIYSGQGCRTLGTAAREPQAWTVGWTSVATASAVAKGWPKLVVPALLIGIWGHVIGTFLGVMVGEVLLRVLQLGTSMAA